MCTVSRPPKKRRQCAFEEQKSTSPFELFTFIPGLVKTDMLEQSIKGWAFLLKKYSEKINIYIISKFRIRNRVWKKSKLFFCIFLKKSKNHVTVHVLLENYSDGGISKENNARDSDVVAKLMVTALLRNAPNTKTLVNIDEIKN